jgi:hypothetical protein
MAGLALPAQLVFRSDQLEHRLAVGGKLGLAIAVLLHPRGFAGLQAQLQFRVDQLYEQ